MGNIFKSIICKKCGSNFEPTSLKSIWCEECCTILCQICGTKIRVKPSRVKTTKYCSKECRRQSDMNYVWKENDIEFIKNNYPFKISSHF